MNTLSVSEDLDRVFTYFQIFRNGLVSPSVRPHHQVFFQGKFRKDLASLGNVRDAQRNDLFGFQAVDLLPVKPDCPFVRLIVQVSHYGFQRGTLTCAVRAEYGPDLTLFNLERETSDHHDFAVVNLYVFRFKHSHCRLERGPAPG